MIRIPMYLAGLFVMTAGIAVSVKSNLGVAPVSSVPYAMTCVWGVEMGIGTIIFHSFMVFTQFLILGQDFKLSALLQVAAGIVFGAFTSFCNYCASGFAVPDNIAVRLAMIVLSALLIALGIFLYLPANLVPLAAEGTVKAISDRWGLDFAKTKIAFDCALVFVSGAVCLAALGRPASVGIGTVIAAVLVGYFLGITTRLFGKIRDAVLQTGEISKG